MGMTTLARRRRYPNGFKPWHKPVRIQPQKYPPIPKGDGKPCVCGSLVRPDQAFNHVVYSETHLDFNKSRGPAMVVYA